MRENFLEPIHKLIIIKITDGILLTKENRKTLNQLNKCLVKIVESDTFSRLLDIKQLGNLNNTFLGATHNRYSHSIGVFYLAKEAIRNNKLRWTKEEQIVFLLGSLLHDVGHGPLSHAFEYFGPKNKIQHELLSSRIIDEILRKYCFNQYSELTFVSDELIKIFSDPKSITKETFICNDKRKGSLYKVFKLLSSQVDVDRLDYLLRDNFNTGVNYNYGNPEFFIRNMVWDKKLKIIYFEEDLKETLSFYLQTRYQMYCSVYYHNSSLYANSLILFLGEWLRRTNCKIDLPLVDISKNGILDIKEYIHQTDSWFKEQIRFLKDHSENKDIVLKKLIRNYTRPLTSVKNCQTLNWKDFSKKFENDVVNKVDKGNGTIIENEKEYLFIKKWENIRHYNNRDPIYISEGDKIRKFKPHLEIRNSHKVHNVIVLRLEKEIKK